MIGGYRHLLFSGLLFSTVALADSESITERLRPSELAARREMQVAFMAAPNVALNLGPLFTVSGRVQLQSGVFFSGEIGQSLESTRLGILMGEVGYSFFKKKGGLTLAVLAGVSHRYPESSFFENRVGFHWVAKARLGWEFLIGRSFSIGITVSGAYYSQSYLSTSEKDGFRLPLELAIPLRIWI